MRYNSPPFAAFLLIVCVALFVLVSGCTGGEDICLTTISEIDDVESLANSRFSGMDISSPDMFTYAQARASKEQYSDALILLTSKGTGCMSDANYKNRLRSLEVKYGFLDIYIRFGEAEEKISALMTKDYTEFAAGVKESISSLERLNMDLLRIKIMADDVDKSILNPDNQDIMNVVKKDIDILTEKTGSQLSILISYR